MKELLIERYKNLKITLNKIPTHKEMKENKLLPKTIKKYFNCTLGEFVVLMGDITYKNIYQPEKRICLNNKCNKLFLTSSDNKDQKFCSKSCGNSITKLKNGIYTDKKCLNCDNKTLNKTSLCSIKCIYEFKFKNIKLSDILRNKNDANKYNNIRRMARKYSKLINDPKCKNCGYDKHFEVCHIKAISSFKDNDTLDFINNKNNLVHLCPNCHWEFDHNLLKLS